MQLGSRETAGPLVDLHRGGGGAAIRVWACECASWRGAVALRRGSEERSPRWQEASIRLLSSPRLLLDPFTCPSSRPLSVFLHICISLGQAVGPGVSAHVGARVGDTNRAAKEADIQEL